MATEKRLIDANALIEALPIVKEDKKITLYGAVADFMIMISAMPTVDAVEVVRCKDCIHWQPGDSFGGDSLDDMQRIGRCPIVRFGRREKDFCCERERKDNE